MIIPQAVEDPTAGDGDFKPKPHHEGNGHEQVAIDPEVDFLVGHAQFACHLV